MSMANTQQKEWIAVGTAARMIGISPKSFRAKATGLGIRCRMLPDGTRRKANRSDVEKLIATLEAREAASVGRPPDQTSVHEQRGTAQPG